VSPNRRRLILEQAHRESEKLFGPITIENAKEAIRWQTERVAELESEAREVRQLAECPACGYYFMDPSLAGGDQ